MLGKHPTSRRSTPPVGLFGPVFFSGWRCAEVISEASTARSIWRCTTDSCRLTSTSRLPGR